MQSKIVTALTVGVLIGLALSHVGSTSEAQLIPEKKKLVWEYKNLQYGPINPSPLQPWSALPDPAGLFNAHAAEGWEATGMVLVSDRTMGGGGVGKVYTFVLKRLKEK